MQLSPSFIVPTPFLASGRWITESGRLTPKLDVLLVRMEELHKQMSLQGYRLDMDRFLDRKQWVESAHALSDVSLLQRKAATDPVAVTLLRFLAREGSSDAAAALKAVDPKHHVTEYMVLGSFGSFMSLTFLTMADNPPEMPIRPVEELIHALAAKLTIEGY